MSSHGMTNHRAGPRWAMATPAAPHDANRRPFFPAARALWPYAPAARPTHSGRRSEGRPEVALRLIATANGNDRGAPSADGGARCLML
jgi:hypothetical protein